MGMNRQYRLLAAWIASLAILLAALAPSVSKWVLASRMGSAVNAEWCAPSKLGLAGPAGKVLASAVSQGDSKGSLPGAHAHEDCPLCLVHAHGMGLPPRHEPWMAVITGAQPVPRLFLHAPRPLFAWSPLSARAPPASA
jgi:hypothetical protein